MKLFVSAMNVLRDRFKDRSTQNKLLWLAAIVMWSACATVRAQYSVFLLGTSVDTFDAIPSAAKWSTRSFIGGPAYWGSAAAVSNIDPAVNGPTNAASTITAAVISTSAIPPGGSAAATYNTTGHFLSTKPAGNAGTFLMATLRNDSGGDLTTFHITYTLTDLGGNDTAAESTPGHRVYYNLGGAAGNWVSLGDHWGENHLTNQAIDIPVFLQTPWVSGTSNYLLFVDVNSEANPDAINAIDNFAIVIPGDNVCPGISSQPQNITVPPCFAGSATFSISTIGAVQDIQWYRQSGADGFNLIPGAKSPSFTLTPIAISDNGAQFKVVVTNSSCTSVTSSVATLSVTADVTPPSVLYAVGYGNATNINPSVPNLTNITIVFSEPIDTNSLGDVSNFTLVDTNTHTPLSIYSAAAPNSTTLVLETEPRNATHGYTLELQFIIDTCGGNEMPDTIVPVDTFQTNPLRLTANWKYLDNDIAPATNWFQINFDDSAWPSGTGPFDAKRNGNYPVAPSNCRSSTFYRMQGPVPTCLNLQSPVTGTNLLTAYFRTHFLYGGKTNATLLALSGKFDDGAVVYLNGTELTRFGLAPPPTVITNGSPATRSVSDTEDRDTAVFLAPASLRPGDNVIAVQLVQQSLTSGDLTMGLELTTFTPEPAPIVDCFPILRSSINGNNLTLTWNCGGTLQKSADISNPALWTTIPGAASPFQTNRNAARQFFRVLGP